MRLVAGLRVVAVTSQRAAASDAEVDDSTFLTAADYEQARARRRASAGFCQSLRCNSGKQPLGCVLNGVFSSLFISPLLCCVAP